MTIEKKIEAVEGLANERAQLQVRLAQIDAELREIFGEKPEKVSRPRKPKTSGGGVKAKDPEPSASSSLAGTKKGGVKHPCCGSKQRRHKKLCAENDGSLPPEEEVVAPLKWECLNCAAVERSVEKPEECECGGKVFIQK